MNSNPKSAVLSESGAASNSYRVAIVGAATLKGKEVAEVMSERNFPAVDIKLLDDDESLGQLETAGDEVTFIQAVRAEQFEHVDFTFLACDATCAGRTWRIAQRAGSAIIDLSYELEGEAGATVRSPWVERQLGQTPAIELQPGPVVAADPAATVLALLLLRGREASAINNVVATVFEPASEQGQKGMDELHEQTVNLLSFQPTPKKIFGAQTAFNLLPRFGEEAEANLQKTESRIHRHLNKIAGTKAITPSLLVLQAPVFHGHAFAIYLETEKPVDLEILTKALAGDHVTIVPGTEEPPSNVSAAGQNEIQVSVSADLNRPNTFWIWAASDNLRVAAASAVACAESITASRPRGTIQ
jgi:aspartate-semialdehyde dehydrogenase